MLQALTKPLIGECVFLSTLSLFDKHCTCSDENHQLSEGDFPAGKWIKLPDGHPSQVLTYNLKD